jgi:O-antigen/teichoic acid export membrane protein
MVVNSPEKGPDLRLPYAARILLLVVLLCISTLLLAFFTLLLSLSVLPALNAYGYYGLAIAVASAAYLLKEFFIRHSYNVGAESIALVIHGVLAVSLVLFLSVNHFYLAPLTVEGALYVYAVAHACAIIAGLSLTRLPFRGSFNTALLGDLREAWQGGRWASVANIVYFVRGQSHTIVVAIVLGPAGVAILAAARLLVQPVATLIPALSQVAMPRLAELRLRTVQLVPKAGLCISMALAGAVVIYSLILMTTYDHVATVVLGQKYQNLFSLTLWWSVYVCLVAVRVGAEISNQVLKRFRLLSYAHTASAVLSLVATYGLTVSYGLPGALIGLCFGECMLLAVLYRELLVGKGAELPISGST